MTIVNLGSLISARLYGKEPNEASDTMAALVSQISPSALTAVENMTFTTKLEMLAELKRINALENASLKKATPSLPGPIGSE